MWVKFTGSAHVNHFVLPENLVMFFGGTCLDSGALTLADHQKPSDKYPPPSP